MPPHNRFAGRDVHIFDGRDQVGGLNLTAGITNVNLYVMIEIFIIFNGENSLRNESNITIEKNNSTFAWKVLYFNSVDPLQINTEMPLLRMISLQTGTRVQAFTDAVRSRDRRCVISGKIALNAHLNRWTGFEAAHIFPLAFEGLWKDHNFGCWIKSPLNGEKIKGGKINSAQNGLLLRSDIRQLFDMYFISINPDTSSQRPADQLLRWHFRQAVSTNMKGAEESVFEYDFPPGSDIFGNILEGPKAAKRMEFELFSRLATQFHLTE
ncbi:hypothetical protein BJ875DRAFT_504056 [Amylocarpus encephaloides]|uniref:HNH nuclease domain-containing protein n=1 Tax=Amylocarpus encephaloides TaxID=45428 RepID=A0A9P7YLN9_9HELO|nr:hypothetical protein BJ875DRAFT_504056 [Amylocarpus encephaloides]